jgi:hypothetical protein
MPLPNLYRGTVSLGKCRENGDAEFAIVLPLLVSSWASSTSAAPSTEAKIEQAAREGAIIAGAQPMSDIASGNGDLTSPGGDSGFQLVGWQRRHDKELAFHRVQPRTPART